MKLIALLIGLTLVISLTNGHNFSRNRLDSLHLVSFMKEMRMEISEDLERDFRAVSYQPQHVHISIGDSPSEMFVTWMTMHDPGESFVEYGPRTFNTKVNAISHKFQESGLLKLTQYIHRARITELSPDQSYVYHCGSDLGISEIFFFKTMKSGSDWSPSFAIYGDLGNVNAQSLVRIQREAQMGFYDAIIHVGDFAYDMDSEDGLRGNAFMDQIQPIAAYFPYMTCPGNHEQAFNFEQYKNRFTMPAAKGSLRNSESMYYSWNIGPIHFISFSTEFYYFLQYGFQYVVLQYEWLEEATKPENRALRPWIITYGHRPMYCSNNNTDDCTKYETLVRVGIPYLHMFGLEDLFMKYGVDLTLWAHEHSYERFWPLYNYHVRNGTIEEPYKNPKALVHVTTGSAGCSEKHDEFIKDVPNFTAFRTVDYGYSRMKVINFTHLYFEQVSEDKEGKVVDSFTLIREKHEPYDFKPKIPIMT